MSIEKPKKNTEEKIKQNPEQKPEQNTEQKAEKFVQDEFIKPENTIYGQNEKVVPEGAINHDAEVAKEKEPKEKQMEEERILEEQKEGSPKIKKNIFSDQTPSRNDDDELTPYEEIHGRKLR